MKNILLVFCLACLPALRADALGVDLNARDWAQLKDKHFVVFYPPSIGEDVPRGILRRAEEYYDRIADRIGYARYHDFWTWDARVQIIYFPDETSFQAATGQPAWSKGFSASHLLGLKLRMIVSFRGQQDFLDTILPHEISHLILHDFMGQRPVPVWFDEGVAQLEEEGSRNNEHAAIMGRLAMAGKTIPFAALEGYELKAAGDPMQVGIFYAETLYIVDFLVKTYGKDAFGELCRRLRDGAPFEEALASAYYPTITSMAVLEDKWIKHMAEGL